MIEEGDGAEAMSPGWWFDWAEGIGVGVVVSCVHIKRRRHTTSISLETNVCNFLRSNFI